MARILIKNGRIFDGERFFYGDILTDGDKIVKIEDTLFDSADYVYDALGKTVSAGLIDIHAHLRGISSEMFGIQGEIGCFPFGVTAAADAGGGRGDKALLDSFMLKSVVFVEVGIKSNRAVFENLEKRLDCYGDRAVGLKVYFDTGVSEVHDTSPLRCVCDYAHSRGLRVMVHSSNSPVGMDELIETLDKGDILTHAFHGGKNNASEDGFECLIRARERGVVIDAGFAGHVHTDFYVLKEAIRRGALPDTVGTDITRYSAYTRGGRYGMTMCMNLARVVGMGEENVFKAVTSSPAKALGKENEWGYLRVGRAADIAVFDYTDESFMLTDKAGNNVRSTEGYRCVLTVSDGQVVYRC